MLSVNHPGCRGTHVAVAPSLSGTVHVVTIVHPYTQCITLVMLETETDQTGCRNGTYALPFVFHNHYNSDINIIPSMTSYLMT